MRKQTISRKEETVVRRQTQHINSFGPANVWRGLTPDPAYPIGDDRTPASSLVRGMRVAALFLCTKWEMHGIIFFCIPCLCLHSLRTSLPPNLSPLSHLPSPISHLSVVISISTPDSSHFHLITSQPPSRVDLITPRKNKWKRSVVVPKPSDPPTRISIPSKPETRQGNSPHLSLSIFPLAKHVICGLCDGFKQMHVHHRRSLHCSSKADEDHNYRWIEIYVVQDSSMKFLWLPLLF